jgi:hypothetical protein
MNAIRNLDKPSPVKAKIVKTPTKNIRASTASIISLEYDLSASSDDEMRSPQKKEIPLIQVGSARINPTSDGPLTPGDVTRS